VIFFALLVYAAYQAFPSTEETPLLQLAGWPSVAAFCAVALWVIAAAANLKWLAVIIIFVAALSLIVPFAARPGIVANAARRTRMLVAWPLALLAGWLTIASFLNLITVFTARGIAPGPIPAPIWGLAGMAAAVAVALGMVARTWLWPFAVPVAWGLVGVFSAEQADGDNLMAMLALGLAFLTAVGAALILVAVRKR
jgi:hypothetical protein